MLNHFMIDLETMGIRPTSAIVSIGIAHFNQTDVLDSFYTPVNLSSCLAHGLTQDQSTVDWWAKQSIEARSAWQTDDAPTLSEALTAMYKWMVCKGSVKTNAPWGNAASFDLVLLANAFRAIEADPPWVFYNEQCYRTIKNIFKIGETPRQGTHHNALDDAFHQARHLNRILAIHKIPLP
jgi:hypothetical protein